MSFDCDVIVVGGGPAGSTAAAWLGRAGHAVGCSNAIGSPDFTSANRCSRRSIDVVEAIGAEEVVRAAGFPKKWGATFMTAGGRHKRYADFGAAAAGGAPAANLAGAARAVRRAPVPPRGPMRRGCSRSASCHRSGVQSGWRDGAGTTLPGWAVRQYSVRAQGALEIDATGRGGSGFRESSICGSTNHGLANVAVFSHYAGVPRAGRPPRWRHPDCRPFRSGLVLADSHLRTVVMSVGVVLPRAAFLGAPGARAGRPVRGG